MVLLWLLVGLFLLLLTLAALRWYTSASPGSVLSVLRWTAIIAGAVLLLLVIFGGVRRLLAIALPLLIPLLTQLPRWIRRIAATSDTSSQRLSTVETRFLRMQLDHDSGSMEGTVLEGEHYGRRLSELPLVELLRLWVSYRVQDEQSADVLEAYLDRTEGPEWREKAQQASSGEDAAGSSGAAHGSMTLEEARAILGVEPGAGAEEIKAAHKRLMQQMHPDRGGSDYLAAKINEARQVLLRQMGD